MVGWIQRMFSIQMYHEEMQDKIEYGCGPIIIGEVIALGLGKLLESESFCSFSQRWFDGFKLYLVPGNSIQMYHEGMEVF
jgi:hypothetical protein